MFQDFMRPLDIAREFNNVDIVNFLTTLMDLQKTDEPYKKKMKKKIKIDTDEIKNEVMYCVLSNSI